MRESRTYGFCEGLTLRGVSLLDCLKQNNTNPNEYFLITMFPGEQIIKEPEDNNIKDIVVLEQTLLFWEQHAIIFEEGTIDSLSIVNECPYNHLWQKMCK